ncbi:hypothetical protein BBJ28_00007598 [Nothophytophthora sp. Chile5]|nr:hypothetical protein BBJ28_00007598 [Nothophytophthora sp. Chile5]
MTVAGLQRELNRRERELMASRRELQIAERRAHRRTDMERKLQVTHGEANDLVRYIIAGLTAMLPALTACSGFLRQQLARCGLSPLRRWFVQLKLLMAEDAEQHTGISTEDADDYETALKTCEETLARDERCFDVSHREGARVSDAVENLLEEEATTGIQELLCFSTRTKGVAWRVTCAQTADKVVFQASSYVANLQEELERRLQEEEETSVDTVIAFIWQSSST